MTDYFSYTLDADAIRAISSIGLAHLGDAVYELLVRTYLCAHGKATGKGLHRATVELVRAPKQAELADAIFGELTDEEHDVFRRGRNANVHTIPHSADRAQYQKATALAAEIARLEKAMKEAAKMLEFELAATLRDQIIELRGK